ncbi:RagB/SusD family nutrient uptake outer membrane protein [Arcticibacter eurypsychrophilus]|uniref:RagB/SusD family nutrient uptake outer membrane protein n=1 Tax=Arcticibacter eurypsychrophilus TaxID=1434752 RepID=UPI00084D2737|nr:RagB/SusD family nutrient uptake outer membrane protein [Arcticibacter eurypsychrophilus]
MKVLSKCTFLILTVAITLQSCVKDLDIAPIANNSASAFYSSEIEVNQAAIGIYARLGRNGTNTDFPTEYFYLASENRADILYIAGETSAQNDQLDLRKYLITPNSGTVNSIFLRMYQIIKEANNLLYFTKEGEYMRYRAEASFLRAYAYSELVRSFGPVALTTAPIESADAIALPRASIAEIYTQIISDLEYASANLADVYTLAQSGRVGSLAAKALLGQVYMTMAGYPSNDATANAKAEAIYASIITGVEARFSPTYAGLFTLANENKYDLFSVQFASNAAGLGSSLPGYITSSSSSGTPFPDWAFSTYSQQGQDLRVDSVLVKEMRANKDLRLAGSIDTAYNTYAKTAKGADTTIVVKKSIITKFLEKDKTNSKILFWNDYPRNFPIIRDADVILLYAEALIKDSKASQAKQYVDKIRVRAGLPALTANPTMDDIKRERKLEFIGEGRRYFDLVRWGEAEAVGTLKAFTVRYHSKLNGLAPAVKDLLLPIPQAEMNNRSNWDQNLGY